MRLSMPRSLNLGALISSFVSYSIWIYNLIGVYKHSKTLVHDLLSLYLHEFLYLNTIVLSSGVLKNNPQYRSSFMPFTIQLNASEHAYGRS